MYTFNPNPTLYIHVLVPTLSLAWARLYYINSQSVTTSGASYITFHPEATNHIDRSLQATQTLEP